MRTSALMATLTIAAATGTVSAAEPAPVVPVMTSVASVAAATPLRPVASPYRLSIAAAPDLPSMRLDDPQSLLRRGYGGSMVDLYPFEDDNLHVSGGGKLFGRAGLSRLAWGDPESLRHLPSLRAGALRGRRASPAMLVGYGRTVEQGLAFGVDAGIVMGRVGAAPERYGRLNRQRLDTLYGSRRSGVNQLARVTALYRF